MGIAADISLIVVAGLVAGVFFRTLGQPTIVGYILVGILLGPYTGGITVSGPREIALLAEIGVALLLFSIGIEFSLRELMAMRRFAIGGTTIQIVATIGLGVVVGLALGWELVPSIWLGGIISLSSTMVVLKTNAQLGVSGTLSSRTMTSMLIVQDLALVPLMIVLPQVSSEIDLGKLSWAMLEAATVLVAIVVVGLRTVPAIMRRIVELQSRELFILAVVSIGLGIGYLAHMAGLSYAVGAFVAGIVLSESDYGHQALSDIIPLRDLFGLLFFTSVGMLINPAFFVEHLVTILILVALVMVGKGLIMAIVTWSFGYRNIVPLAAAFGMAQIGELSFLISRVGVDLGAIDRTLYEMIIGVTIISMLVTPYLAKVPGPVYRAFRRRIPADVQLPAFEGEDELNDHVVIVGGGRLGSKVATIVREFGFEAVVIDIDMLRIQQARQSGAQVIFGDGSQPEILKAAGIETARQALVTVPGAILSHNIIEAIRAMRPTLHVVARAETLEYASRLRNEGVCEVVQPEFEAGLEMARQALLNLDAPLAEIHKFLDAVRHETLPDIIGASSTRSKGLDGIRKATRSLDLHWIQLGGGSASSGRTLGEIGIRSSTGTTVIAIVRGSQVINNPGTDFVFEGGDWVGAIGTVDQVQALRALIS